VTSQNTQNGISAPSGSVVGGKPQLFCRPKDRANARPAAVVIGLVTNSEHVQNLPAVRSITATPSPGHVPGDVPAASPYDPAPGAHCNRHRPSTPTPQRSPWDSGTRQAHPEGVCASCPVPCPGHGRDMSGTCPTRCPGQCPRVLTRLLIAQPRPNRSTCRHVRPRAIGARLAKTPSDRQRLS